MQPVLEMSGRFVIWRSAFYLGYSIVVISDGMFL